MKTSTITARRVLLPLLAITCFASSSSTLSAKPIISPEEGIPSVQWQDAHTVVGKMARVSGKIIRVGHARTIHFLNFDNNRPGDFTAVIRENNIGNFRQTLEEAYEGKLVTITGLVTTYRDKPQIQVAKPEQIKVIDKLPAFTTNAKSASKSVKGQVKIASYNILNLFDESDDPYRNDEAMSAKSRAEMENVAKALKEIDADIVAFQEVENRGYLQRFLDVFVPELGYDQVVHFEGNNVRGIDVCLASRVPVGPVTSYRHVAYPGPNGKMRHFERDVLAVTLQPENAKPFEVWVVHLKSNFGGREHAEPIRVAEAKQIRNMLDERLKADSKARILLCGDFNDTWDSETLKTIVGEGSNAMSAFFDELSEPQRITYNRGRFRSMIDFILGTPAIAKSYVKGSYAIRPGTVENSGSDHNPVYATFKLK